MRKHNKGGSSSNRFERIRQHNVQDYIKNIYKQIDETISSYSIENIIFSGSKSKINEIINNHKSIKKLTIGVISENLNIVDLINKGRDIVHNTKYQIDKKYRNKIENMIETEPDKLVFGQDNIMEDLYIMKKIYISEDLYNDYFNNHNLNNHNFNNHNSNNLNLNNLNLNNHNSNNDTFIIIYSDWIKPYGGIIGVKYY